MPKIAERPDLSAALLDLADEQHAALSRSQLGVGGISDPEIRSLHRSGILRPSHRGVHILVSRDVGLRTRAMAAQLTSASPSFAGLETAATLRGWLDEWEPDPVRLVMDPATKTRQALARVERHWHAIDPDDVVMLGRLGLTGDATTIRDLALHRSRETMVGILDSALHRGLVAPELIVQVAETLAPSRTLWLPHLDARSESPLESVTRLLMVDDGLHPEPQHEVRVAGRTYRLDLPFPRWKVTVECDGEGWHGKPKPLYVDRERMSDLHHAGWTIVRSTWDDRRHRPKALLRRIHRALADNGCPSSR